MIRAERKIRPISAMIGPLLRHARWLNGILLKVRPELRAIFCLPAANRPQNLHTDCHYSRELSKRRGSSLIFPAGNMKRNLFACRKGHKGMSNMISGNLLQCVKTLGMLLFLSLPTAYHILPLCPCQVNQCVKCESVCRESAFSSEVSRLSCFRCFFWWIWRVCCYQLGWKICSMIPIYQFCFVLRDLCLGIYCYTV